MSFHLNDFATSKWNPVLLGTGQILNRTPTSFQAQINAPTDTAWLVTSSPVDISNIDLEILMDLMPAGTFLYIGAAPPGTPATFNLPCWVIIRSKSAYNLLVYNGGAYYYVGPAFPNNITVVPSAQAKVGWKADTITGLLHAFWQDTEITSTLYNGMPIPSNFWGWDITKTYVAIGALGLEHNANAIGTSTFTVPTPPLTINITPTSAAILAGGTQTFHANLSGGASPTVAWYVQGNTTPLGTGTDITIQFPDSGTYQIYAVVTDPTAPNSPLQSNNSIVTVNAATYTLTITASQGGTTNPAPGIITETAGSSVPIIATPNLGYIFSHWETNDPNNNSVNPTITVQMTLNITITAVFAVVPPSMYTLIVDSTPVEGIQVTVTKM